MASVNIASSDNITGIRLKEQASSPTTPPAGFAQLYVNTTPAVQFEDDAGTVRTLSDTTHTHAAADITSGTLDNARVNWASPSAIGATTASTLRGTTLALTNTSGTVLQTLGGDVVFNENGTTGIFRVESDTNANMLYVDGTNNRVGIATGSPSVTLDVNGNQRIYGTSPELNIYSTDTGNRRLLITVNTTTSKTTIDSTYGTVSAFPLVFQTAGNDRLTIGTSGTITSPQTYSTTVGATNRALYVDDTGLIGYLSSRAGMKNSVVSLSTTYDTLMQQFEALNPVSFYYNNDLSGQRRFGLIAEEVDAINPHWVSYDPVLALNEETGEMYDTGELVPATVSYNDMISVLIAVVQQLNERIKVLEGA